MRQDLDNWLWRLDSIEQEMERLVPAGNVHVLFLIAIDFSIKRIPQIGSFGGGEVLHIHDRAVLKYTDAMLGLSFDLGYGGLPGFPSWGGYASETEALPFVMRIGHDGDWSVGERMPIQFQPENSVGPLISETLMWSKWYYCEVHQADADGEESLPGLREIEVVDLEKAVLEACALAPPPVVRKIGNLSSLRCWPTALFYLAMKRFHPAIQAFLQFMPPCPGRQTPPDEGTFESHDLIITLKPDLRTATRYAFDLFRRAAQAKGASAGHGDDIQFGHTAGEALGINEAIRANDCIAKYRKREFHGEDKDFVGQARQWESHLPARQQPVLADDKTNGNDLEQVGAAPQTSGRNGQDGKGDMGPLSQEAEDYEQMKRPHLVWSIDRWENAISELNPGIVAGDTDHVHKNMEKYSFEKISNQISLAMEHRGISSQPVEEFLEQARAVDAGFKSKGENRWFGPAFGAVSRLKKQLALESIGLRPGQQGLPAGGAVTPAVVPAGQSPSSGPPMPDGDAKETNEPGPVAPGGEGAGIGSKGPGPAMEGEWSLPMSKIDMRVRLGNMAKDKFETFVVQYELKRINRQLYQIRLDTMDSRTRRRLETGR